MSTGKCTSERTLSLGSPHACEELGKAPADRALGRKTTCLMSRGSGNIAELRTETKAECTTTHVSGSPRGDTVRRGQGNVGFSSAASDPYPQHQQERTAPAPAPWQPEAPREKTVLWVCELQLTVPLESPS